MLHIHNQLKLLRLILTIKIEIKIDYFLSIFSTKPLIKWTFTISLVNNWIFTWRLAVYGEFLQRTAFFGVFYAVQMHCTLNCVWNIWTDGMKCEEKVHGFENLSFGISLLGCVCVCVCSMCKAVVWLLLWKYVTGGNIQTATAHGSTHICSIRRFNSVIMRIFGSSESFVFIRYSN